MYTTIDGIDYVSIVDYKTGKDKALLDNVDYGFNLQLPVYAYFLAKTALLKNPKIIGIYLHRILNDVKPTSTKTLSIVKRDALKLDGYSLTDRRELELFDPTYKNSQFLRGMSMTKDGSFARFAKVFSDEDISNLITTVERLILEAFEKIESGSFVINPKKVDNINLSCGFCPYKNICYKQNRDINEIKSEQFKETIVGDE
jgi:ATP-dependent helicase/DNAse subunit B